MIGSDIIRECLCPDDGGPPFRKTIEKDSFTLDERVEIILWRKASEEFPVPQSDVDIECDTVFVLTKGPEGVLVALYDVSDQSFENGFEAVYPDYWVYLPTGPRG